MIPNLMKSTSLGQEISHLPDIKLNDEVNNGYENIRNRWKYIK